MHATALLSASCFDLGKNCPTVGTWSGACASIYYSYDEPSYDGQTVANVCPETCADHFPEKSCQEWKYYPEDPPAQDGCQYFVSKNAAVTNLECRDICDETDDCTFQLPQATDCYGDVMYGYSEENELEYDSNDPWSTVHYAVVMAAGSEPSDCQQLCQETEGCGFFGFRQAGTLDDSRSPTCLLKTRESVVAANNQSLPASYWPCSYGQECYDSYTYCNVNLAYECNEGGNYDCKGCDGTPVCAWHSYYHVSGPRVCDGTDSWMERDDTCDVPTTEFPAGGGESLTDEPEQVTEASGSETTELPTAKPIQVVTSEIPSAKPIQVGTSEIPTAKPIQVVTSEIPTAKPIQVVTSEIPTAKPIQVVTSEIPTAKPIQVVTSEIPTAKPIQVVTSDIPTAKPIQVVTSEIPTAKPIQVGTSEIPTAKPIQVGTSEIPTAKPIQVVTSDIPTAKPIQVGTSEIPTAKPIQVGTSEIPTAKPIQVVTSEIPTAKPIQVGTSEIPTAKPIQVVTSEIPTATPIQVGTSEIPTAKPIDVGTTEIATVEPVEVASTDAVSSTTAAPEIVQTTMHQEVVTTTPFVQPLETTTAADDSNRGVVVGSAVGGVLAAGGAVVAALMAKGVIPVSGKAGGEAAIEDVELNEGIQEREQLHEFDGDMFA